MDVTALLVEGLVSIASGGIAWGVLQERVREAREIARSAQAEAASARIDTERLAVRLAVAETNLLNHGRELERSLGRMEGTMNAMHRRLDAFLGQRSAKDSD